MTVLSKPLRRELPGSYDRRQWSVTLHPWGIDFRAKRSRKSYSITWESVFHRTMELAAQHERCEKARAYVVKKWKSRA